jgi:hypothetical protein
VRVCVCVCEFVCVCVWGGGGGGAPPKVRIAVRCVRQHVTHPYDLHHHLGANAIMCSHIRA